MRSGLADVVEREGFPPLVCVIDTESPAEVSCSFEMGKITIPREQITQIIYDSKEQNVLLKKQWMKKKAAYKKSLDHKPPSDPQGRPMAVHKAKWITYEDYESIRKAKTDEEERRLAEEVEAFGLYREEKARKDREKALLETVQQGADMRSPFVQKMLSEGVWSMQKEDLFTVFSDTDEVPPFVDTLTMTASKYVPFLKDALALTLSSLSVKKIEIFILSDSERWSCVSRELPDREITHVAGIAQKKELFVYLFDNTQKGIEVSVHGFLHELTHLFLQEFVMEQFGKKYPIPLWLTEGFAFYNGQIEECLLGQEELKKGVVRNYYLKLHELMIAASLPENPLRRSFFYTESAVFFEFLINAYGKDAVSAFIFQAIEVYNEEKTRNPDLTKERAKKIMRLIIERSFLRKDYSGYAPFEESWLRYMSQRQ